MGPSSGGKAETSKVLAGTQEGWQPPTQHEQSPICPGHSVPSSVSAVWQGYCPQGAQGAHPRDPGLRSMLFRGVFFDADIAGISETSARLCCQSLRRVLLNSQAPLSPGLTHQPATLTSSLRSPPARSSLLLSAPRCWPLLDLL